MAASKSDQERWLRIRELLDEAVLKLPRKQQEALVLHYYCGKTYKEIAAELRCPQDTVRTRIQRGRTALRSKLSKRDVDASTALLAFGLSWEAARLVDAAFFKIIVYLVFFL